MARPAHNRRSKRVACRKGKLAGIGVDVNVAITKKERKKVDY
jgi:hypothetical protein